MPKVVDPVQRRREIIHALWAVISDRGIEGVTFQAVAKAAGISVGRIQHYFESKEDLVQEGCLAIVAEAESRYFAATTTDNPWEALRALLIQPIPRNRAFRLGVAVWHAYLARAVVDPKINRIVSGAARGALYLATSLLDVDGAVPEDQRATAALRLLSVSDGLSQRVLVGATTAKDAIAAIDAELAQLKEDWIK